MKFVNLNARYSARRRSWAVSVANIFSEMFSAYLNRPAGLQHSQLNDPKIPTLRRWDFFLQNPASPE